ncbi:hypothetical protein GQ457_05G014170 [Hibiscus cannabinus]
MLSETYGGWPPERVTKKGRCEDDNMANDGPSRNEFDIHMEGVEGDRQKGLNNSFWDTLGDSLLPKIRFSDRFHDAIDEKLANSLIIRLLGKSIGYRALLNCIHTLWNPVGELQLIDLDNDYFLVRFVKEVDFVRVLSDGPWVIYGSYLTVQSWSRPFSTNNVTDGGGDVQKVERDPKELYGTCMQVVNRRRKGLGTCTNERGKGNVKQGTGTMGSRFVILHAEPELEIVHECHNDYDVGQYLELANSGDSTDTVESIRSIRDEQMELDEGVVMVGDGEVRNTTMNLARELDHAKELATSNNSSLLQHGGPVQWQDNVAFGHPNGGRTQV